MEAILGAPPNICLMTIPRGLDPRWIRDGDEHLGQCKAEKTAFEEYANLPAHIRVWTFRGVQSNARPKVSTHSYTLREFCIPSLIQRASVVPPTEGATNDSSLRASAMSNRKDVLTRGEFCSFTISVAHGTEFFENLLRVVVLRPRHTLVRSCQRNDISDDCSPKRSQYI